MLSQRVQLQAHRHWMRINIRANYANVSCVTSVFQRSRSERPWSSRQHERTSLLRPARAEPSASSLPDLGAVMQRSEELLSRNQVNDAIEIVKTAQQKLEGGEQGQGSSSLLLQQYLSLLLFTAGDYGGAAEEAKQAYQQLCRAVGKHEVQSILLAMRLGIYEMANGDLESGVQRTFESGALALPLLNEAMQEAQSMGSGGAPQEALQEQDLYVRRLMGHMGESAFYYSLGTARQMAADGDVKGLLESWEQMEGNMVRGLTDMAAIMGASTPPVANALREHARLVADFDGEEQLAGRLRQQSSSLRAVVQGTAKWQQA